MLTKEAMTERQWRPYPTLRQVLENKKVPDAFHGPSSVSDNMFARIDRLIEIAILVDEYRTDIKNAALSLGQDELARDLYEIQNELEGALEYFRAMRDRVRAVLNDLR